MVNERKYWKPCVVRLALLAAVMVFGLIVSGCQNRQPALSKDGLRVYFLDVGQGNAQLLISPEGKTMLIDAGNNDKEKLMLDYMQKYGIRKLDVVIGSHPDADHIGGLDKVIDQLEIGAVYMPRIGSNTSTYESLLRAIDRKGLKVKTAKSGTSIAWDSKTQVELLGPVNTYDDTNEMSAVVKVSYGDTSFLFPGDAESTSEKDMVASGTNLSATVLAVGHHGSNSSTSAAFLKQVHPAFAVFQVGENNYGHPSDKIVKRLKDQGAKLYRTDRNGTVTFVSDGRNVQVQAEKGQGETR